MLESLVRHPRWWLLVALMVLASTVSVHAQTVPSPSAWPDLAISVAPTAADDGSSPQTATVLRVAIVLTLLSLLPAILICVTAFLRIIVVLSMLRHALGMPQTPPNSALIGLALFLTLFTMSPVMSDINKNAFHPFISGGLSMEEAYDKAVTPIRAFMAKQTREEDLALMMELSDTPFPDSLDDISNVQLIPAFMLSELRAAFQIGFVIFLPFLLIDLIVSSVLMGLGMMMMPPVTVSLPIKILLFVLIDGWGLVLRSTVGSFH